jgi:hypothetical protein
VGHTETSLMGHTETFQSAPVISVSLCPHSMFLQLSGYNKDAIEEQIIVTYLCCRQNTSDLNK